MNEEENFLKAVKLTHCIYSTMVWISRDILVQEFQISNTSSQPAEMKLNSLFWDMEIVLENLVLHMTKPTENKERNVTIQNLIYNEDLKRFK